MICKITTPQMRFIYKLIRELGLQDEKRTLVQLISEGRTTSMKELTCAEARRLIKKLSGASQLNDPRQRMQRAVLSMAHQLGWTLAENPTTVDMAAVNAWCTKNGYLHKPIDDYTTAEMPKLVQQFTRMYVNLIKKK